MPAFGRVETELLSVRREPCLYALRIQVPRVGRARSVPGS